MDLREIPRYAISEIRQHYDDRFWWRSRFLHRIIGPFHTRIYPTRSDGVDVMAEDWDTLLVLDACRADLFRERADPADYGGYRTITSIGSATREWTIQHFADRTFPDTVYVTANPYVSREASGSFHRLVEPWLDGFDEDVKTVRPEVVAEVARDVHEEHPDKRIIVHFMQPHHPFITAPDLQFDGWQIDEFDDWSEQKRRKGLDRQSSRPHTPWDALYMGLTTREAVWRAYAENLDLALDAIEGLLPDVPGKTAITSDHGNMFGERTWPVPIRVYGHPAGVRNRELTDVPWATVTNGPRREITEGTLMSETESDSVEMENRLQDLGYL